MIMNLKQIQELIEKGFRVKFYCKRCGKEIIGMPMESGFCIRCSKEVE